MQAGCNSETWLAEGYLLSVSDVLLRCEMRDGMRWVVEGRKRQCEQF